MSRSRCRPRGPALGITGTLELIRLSAAGQSVLGFAGRLPAKMKNRFKENAWVFPLGAILTIGGVFLYALLERHSFTSTEDWEFAILDRTFVPALLLGSLLTIVGSILDRVRLPVAKTRIRGLLCLVASGVFYVLLDTTGNVHGWTFSFIFPALVSFVSGVILLSKLKNQADAV